MSTAVTPTCPPSGPSRRPPSRTDGADHGSAGPPYPLRVRRPGGLWWVRRSHDPRSPSALQRPLRRVVDGGRSGEALGTGGSWETLTEVARHPPLTSRRLLQRHAPSAHTGPDV